MKCIKEKHSYDLTHVYDREKYVEVITSVQMAIETKRQSFP